jgi:hypothetical protein
LQRLRGLRFGSPEFDVLDGDAMPQSAGVPVVFTK